MRSVELPSVRHAGRSVLLGDRLFLKSASAADPCCEWAGARGGAGAVLSLQPDAGEVRALGRLPAPSFGQLLAGPAGTAFLGARDDRLYCLQLVRPPPSAEELSPVAE